jgi:hypothetical protein
MPHREIYGKFIIFKDEISFMRLPPTEGVNKFKLLQMVYV